LGETVQIVWKEFNGIKFCSGRNSEQFEIRECLLSFGADSFVYPKLQRIRYTEL